MQCRDRRHPFCWHKRSENSRKGWSLEAVGEEIQSGKSRGRLSLHMEKNLLAASLARSLQWHKHTWELPCAVDYCRSAHFLWFALQKRKQTVSLRQKLFLDTGRDQLSARWKQQVETGWIKSTDEKESHAGIALWTLWASHKYHTFNWEKDINGQANQFSQSLWNVGERTQRPESYLMFMQGSNWWDGRATLGCAIRHVTKQRRRAFSTLPISHKTVSKQPQDSGNFVSYFIPF